MKSIIIKSIMLICIGLLPTLANDSVQTTLSQRVYLLNNKNLGQILLIGKILSRQIIDNISKLSPIKSDAYFKDYNKSDTEHFFGIYNEDSIIVMGQICFKTKKISVYNNINQNDVYSFSSDSLLVYFKRAFHEGTPTNSLNIFIPESIPPSQIQHIAYTNGALIGPVKAFTREFESYLSYTIDYPKNIPQKSIEIQLNKMGVLFSSKNLKKNR